MQQRKQSPPEEEENAIREVLSPEEEENGSHAQLHVPVVLDEAVQQRKQLENNGERQDE